jgi:hypothetical protein
MKLIIKEYLSSLKERGELDAVLPDLLSQLGLNVFSRPARGTRQDGVDVAAVGSLDGEVEKVYLFSIKPGDLSRRDWDGDSAQSLRPSLNEIFDSFLPNRLPPEHRLKPIVICIAIGGDVQEPVRPLLTGFVAQNTKDGVAFEEWNGDKIAAHIEANFLREDLLPEDARSLLRKSLALLDEPEVAYRHFAQLIRKLCDVDTLTDAQRVTAVRQMNICLWILFSWARQASNVEVAYVASEITMLHAWKILRSYVGKDNKTSRAIEGAFHSIFSAYCQISTEYFRKNIFPYAEKAHAVSSAIRSSNSLDINFKLFDVVGRLGVDGLWCYWGAMRCSEQEKDLKDARLDEMQTYVQAIKDLISNNPALLLPARDDQAIDINIATSLLVIDPENREFILSWLREMQARAQFSIEANTKYPCVFRAYSDLLEHPKSVDTDYRESATSASVLYPTIALWCALLDDGSTYAKVATMKKNLLEHCTFQFWYPDETSETHFYDNSAVHGAALANLAIDRSKEEFLAQVFDECKHSPQFKDLSAVKFGWWPLIVVACRHYRLPLPMHLLEGLNRPASVTDSH